MLSSYQLSNINRPPMTPNITKELEYLIKLHKLVMREADKGNKELKKLLVQARGDNE